MTAKATISTKKLNRVRLVNWMYFGDETFPINKGSVLISGENAAGKSTVLDAIQMVLTGNSTKFNKAANENSDRDLKSYVRCKIGTTEKTYLREGNVISNIALEFFEEKENRFFVIGVHITSGNENETPDKRWYIENGKLEDFSFVTKDEKPSMPEEFRKNGEKISFIKNLGEYKNNLRYRLGNLEEKFFEVLLKALAFRPVDNVKDFINKYVLTEKTIDVQSLRESIDVLNEFEQTLKKAKLERNELEKILSQFSVIDENVHNQKVNDMLLKIAEREKLESDKAEYEIKIRIDEQKLRDVKSELESKESLQNEKQAKLIELNQTFNNSDYKRLTEKIQESVNKLSADEKIQTDRKNKLLREIKSIRECLSAFLKIKDVPVSQEELKCLEIVSDKSKKAEIVGNLDTFIKNEIEGIRESKIKFRSERQDISGQIAKLDSEIASLESKNIRFPEETERLRQNIQSEFKEKGIDSPVYIFAELLSITDKTWTNAIEGYLNTQRFYLVVEPEYYNLALEIYNANKKSYNQGIINFRKLPESEVESNSLANFVETENRYARRYADFILGKVICCEDLRELENYSSSITKDCMVYKNYVSRKIDPKIYAKPFIGKDAIEVQLANAKAQRKNFQEKLPSLREKIAMFEQVEQSYENVNFAMVKEYLNSPNQLAEISKQLQNEKAELEKIQKDPDTILLQERIEQARLQLKELSDSIKKLERQKINLENEVEKSKNCVSEIEEKLSKDSKEFFEYQDKESTIYNEANEKYLDQRKKLDISKILENFESYKKTLDGRKLTLLNELCQMQGSYNSTFGKDYISGLAGFAQFKNQFDKLNTIEIVRTEETIRKSRDKCEDIFRNEFLSKMKESIESAHYEFENLKKALKDINYGEDTYKFTISHNKQKQNLYKMIMADDNLGSGNLFSDNFESEFKEEIDELFTKIKAGDSSDKTVREYTDYRTYLDYDIEIHKKNGTVQKLSEKAKSNSGGESQVPFYVIMAASLNNIYRSDNSVRLLLLDEAFNNMDEQRISSVMKFFNQLQFQTILVAPSPKIQDIEENVDSVLTVMREDTVSFVEDFRYYGE
ncbi:ATP-binding protein [Treponema zioleckii]|uniref:ATP-binding protein n=1 Tax=Treponema zioleckii TaxID=331680 RepID=UPI00168B517D|nr:SbcC/MukB-like Walker B domain-containing protein [Treponema zioleckii]